MIILPTCLTTVEGGELRRRGNEHGFTTGRPRVCDWMDLPAFSYACRVGSVTHLILTKLDILSDFPTDIAVCSKYRYNGRVVSRTDVRATGVPIADTKANPERTALMLFE